MARERVPFSYRALQAWGRSAVSVFYRRVEVTAAENLPTDRPAILAVNHGNALADIAVIVAKMPNFPRFLAAATWWKSAPARVLFRLGGVVPIHRRRDSVDTEQNTSTFEACHAALATGAHIVIFPEGKMHLEPALLPLKTGTARIALGAATAATAAGVRGPVIVPVGIVYDDRGRFRSDAEIHFGEPIEIDEWIEPCRADPAKAVRGLTDLLADRLARVTVNHGSRAEAVLLDRAAALALIDSPGDPSVEAAYARRNALRRALASAVAMAGGESSAEYRELEAAVDAHTTDFEQLGIVDSRLLPSLAEPSAEQRARLELELAVLTPPAVLGALANGPVLFGARLASTRARHESWQATTKGVTGTFLSPVVWTLEFVFLSRRYGRRHALALTTAGAISGLATLAWRERWLRWRGIAWRDRMARDRPAALAAARASRRAVNDRVDSLLGDR